MGISGVIPWKVHVLEYGCADLLTKKEPAKPSSDWCRVQETAEEVRFIGGLQGSKIKLVVRDYQPLWYFCSIRNTSAI